MITGKSNGKDVPYISPYGTLSTIPTTDKVLELDQARKDLVKIDRALHGHTG